MSIVYQQVVDGVSSERKGICETPAEVIPSPWPILKAQGISRELAKSISGPCGTVLAYLWGVNAVQSDSRAIRQFERISVDHAAYREFFAIGTADVG